MIIYEQFRCTFRITVVNGFQALCVTCNRSLTANIFLTYLSASAIEFWIKTILVATAIKLPSLVGGQCENIVILTNQSFSNYRYEQCSGSLSPFNWLSVQATLQPFSLMWFSTLLSMSVYIRVSQTKKVFLKPNFFRAITLRNRMASFFVTEWIVRKSTLC